MVGPLRYVRAPGRAPRREPFGRAGVHVMEPEGLASGPREAVAKAGPPVRNVERELNAAPRLRRQPLFTKGIGAARFRCPSTPPN